MKSIVDALFYLCACGCKVSPDDIIKIRGFVDGEQLNRRGCPKHKNLGLGAVVIDNILRCDMCGELFQGRKAHYCLKCRPEHKKEAMREYGKLYNKSVRLSVGKPKKQIDGKKEWSDCSLFGGEVCGRVCVEPEFYCRMGAL